MISGESERRDPAAQASAASWDHDLADGVKGLADDLLPIFYDDLKRLARSQRRRVGPSETLQTTALVHEAYLRLRSSRGWNDESHFLRAAALAMRHALVNHAHARTAQKRGDGAVHVSLTEGLDVALRDDDTVLALNEALERLAAESVRLARVVECRYFAGYDERETAAALQISERTVRRDWTLARAWLHRELSS
jgi:RNA polymerase sigma factor (TIGR02999 family)